MSDRWLALRETTNGRLAVEGSEEVARRAYEEHRNVGYVFGQPVLVLGGALVDDHGRVVRAWGRPPDPAAPPLFEAVRHLPEGVWAKCSNCGGEVSPGQLRGALTQACRACLEAADPLPRGAWYDQAAYVPSPTACPKAGCRKLGRVYRPELGVWLCPDHSTEEPAGLSRRENTGG